MQEAAKDKDIVISVDRWMKTIEEKGGKGWFNDCINGNPKLYMIAWCTKFQLEVRATRPLACRNLWASVLLIVFTITILKVMKDDSLISCVDSTRGIARSLRPEKTERTRKNKRDFDTSAYLFTILVKDRVLQKGIPVAYMLCSSESS